MRRLVGVAVPEGAVEEVLRRLQGSSQTAAISLDSDTDDDDLQARACRHPVRHSSLVA